MLSALRSFLAVFAGLFVMMVSVIVLTLIAVKAFGLKSGHPTPTYLVLNVLYSVGAAVLGGWVTGRIARSSSLQHGYALSAAMVIMGLLSYWHYSSTQPLWYQVLLVVLPAGCALLGVGLAIRHHGPLGSAG